MKDLQSAAIDLQHIVTIADRNFQIWWALVNRVKEYAESLNLYSDFFSPSIDAFQRVYFLELSRLMEKRKDVVCLHSFFKSFSLRDSSIESDYVRILKAKSTEVRAIRIIRNKAIAHADLEQSIQQVFAEANVTINQIRDFIEALVDIVRRIIRDVETGTGTISDVRRYEFATMALVKDIFEWQEAIPKKNRRVWLTAPY